MYIFPDTGFRLEYAKNAFDEGTFLPLFETLCRIPAPSLGETARTAFILEWLHKHGLGQAYADEAGNVLVPWRLDEKTAGFPLYMAHIDVVFSDTAELPLTRTDTRLSSPGCGDNTACAAMLMVFLAYICRHPGRFPGSALFALNTGEEGLGNLAGCRKIFRDFAGRISQAVSFDGGVNGICNRAVGSLRYRVTVRTEGGHSYNDFGRPNAIALLCGLVGRLYQMEIPEGPGRSTFNIGTISGGTSVNTIAQDCSCLFEYRSDRRENLKKMEQFFLNTLNAFGREVHLEWDCVGSRPCMGETDLAAVERLTAQARESLEAEGFSDMPIGSGSTDCNIPLSLGIPAVCFGGLLGGGVHTREEYVDISRTLAMGRCVFRFLLKRN